MDVCHGESGSGDGDRGRSRAPVLALQRYRAGAAGIVTRNGRPRNVLISVEEYDRLKKRDQQAFLAADMPDEFLSDIEALLGGRIHEAEDVFAELKARYAPPDKG